MSLYRRGSMRAAGRAAGMDYRVLVATLQAMQLATATARAGARSGAADSDADGSGREPLTLILLGAQNWQDAVLVQGGSFNPAQARGSEQR